MTSTAAAAGDAARRQVFGIGADAALSLADVGRRFGALVALEGISLEVPANGRHAILGANGAGKTTLFNCITGDFPPTTGNIRLFGEDVTDRPAHERIRRGLRRTYQTSLLFGGLSVADNLFLAEQGVQAGRFSFRRIRANAGLRARARRLAEYVALENDLERTVDELSHGQQRQLEIGMALAGRPRLILLDEPAAGLSQSERTLLTRTLLELPAGVAFVLIEHDLEVALRVAEHITVLHNGRPFTAGTPETIENDPAVQEIYLGRPDD